MYLKTHLNFDNAKVFNELMSKLVGFADISWKNNTCPSMHKWLNERDDHYIEVFVDYTNPELRESIELSEFLVVHNKGTDRTAYNAHSTKEVIEIIEGL